MSVIILCGREKKGCVVDEAATAMEQTGTCALGSYSLERCRRERPCKGLRPEKKVVNPRGIRRIFLCVTPES